MPIAKLTKHGLGLSGLGLFGAYWLLLALFVELFHRLVEKPMRI